MARRRRHRNKHNNFYQHKPNNIQKDNILELKDEPNKPSSITNTNLNSSEDLINSKITDQPNIGVEQDTQNIITDKQPENIDINSANINIPEEITTNDTINNNIPECKKNNTIYIGYTERLIINIVIFVIALISTIFFVYQSFTVNQAEIVTYQEQSNIDYKVYLKENNFYETEYLDKNMSYISSLIDSIKPTFKYHFDISQNTNIKFNYDIIGKLIIKDNSEKNTFYEKDFVLLKNKELTIKNSNHQTIIETLNINYDYYNNIANDFRTKFGVSTTSNLIVSLKINAQSMNDNINLNSNETMSLTIPLSQREVNIKLSTENLNNNESIVKESNIQITNYIYLLLACITAVITIISFIKLLKKIIIINPPKSEYDKYVSKILKEYDRFIANTKVGPIVYEGDKVIQLSDFQELLDVRDSLRVPINYYNIVSHQKCLFYLNKGNLIYKYYLKAVDLEKKENK